MLGLQGKAAQVVAFRDFPHRRKHCAFSLCILTAPCTPAATWPRSCCTETQSFFCQCTYSSPSKSRSTHTHLQPLGLCHVGTIPSCPVKHAAHKAHSGQADLVCYLRTGQSHVWSETRTGREDPSKASPTRTCGWGLQPMPRAN